MLQINAVPSGTMDILNQVASQPCLENFRLVGGTSLALQIGHRLSYDLDLFSERKNDLLHIENELARYVFKKQSILCPFFVDERRKN